MSYTPLHDALHAAIAHCLENFDAEIDRISETDLLLAARVCLTIAQDCDPELKCGLIRRRAERRWRRILKKAKAAQ